MRSFGTAGGRYILVKYGFCMGRGWGEGCTGRKSALRSILCDSSFLTKLRKSRVRSVFTVSGSTRVSVGGRLCLRSSHSRMFYRLCLCPRYWSLENRKRPWWQSGRGQEGGGVRAGPGAQEWASGLQQAGRRECGSGPELHSEPALPPGAYSGEVERCWEPSIFLLRANLQRLGELGAVWSKHTKSAVQHS